MSAKSTATKPCEACGEPVKIGGRGHNPKRRFCSRECASSVRKVVRQCQACGGETKRTFCSRECFNASRDVQKAEFKCAKCGVTFLRWPSQRRLTAKKTYCSSKCRAAGRVYASGKDHPGYKPVSRWIRSDGYVYIEDEENGRILEHRLAMEKKLGRKLTKHETVHHINGDRADNRVENLQLRQGNHGRGTVMACLDCGSHNLGKVPIA